MDRDAEMVEIKHKDFTDGVPIMSSEFTHYDRSSGTRSMIDMVYAEINIVNNTKFNHIMVSFTDHYNTISLDRLLSENKIGKD